MEGRALHPSQPLVLLHHLGSFPRRVRSGLVLRVCRHHLQASSTHLLPVQRGHGSLGLLLPRILGVPARLPVEQVDVDQAAEPAEHVLKCIEGRGRGGADDEQALRHHRVHGG